MLGNDHADTLDSVNSLGGLLRDLGRPEEAEALGAEAVRGARRSLPQRHLPAALYLTSYGKTLTQLERFGDAEAALLEAREILEHAFDAKHFYYFRTAHALVKLYDAWGKPDKAARYREMLPRRKDTEPDSEIYAKPGDSS